MNFEAIPISFKFGGQKIVGTIYRPKQNVGLLPGVVMYHGRGSSSARYTDRAEAVVKREIATLIFSFRGCGDSQGDFSDQTIANGMNDALTGYDFLVQQSGIDKNKIGIFGSSFGGYLAALVAGERPVKSLILSAPAIYHDRWWDKVVEKTTETPLSRGLEDVPDTKAIRSIKSFKGNLLVIRHQKDEFIAQSVVEAYYKNAVSAKRKDFQIIKGLMHRLVEKKDRDYSNKLTADWFAKTL